MRQTSVQYGLAALCLSLKAEMVVASSRDHEDNLSPWQSKKGYRRLAVVIHFPVSSFLLCLGNGFSFREVYFLEFQRAGSGESN